MTSQYMGVGGGGGGAAPRPAATPSPSRGGGGGGGAASVYMGLGAGGTRSVYMGVGGGAAPVGSGGGGGGGGQSVYMGVGGGPASVYMPVGGSSTSVGAPGGGASTRTAVGMEQDAAVSANVTTERGRTAPTVDNSAPWTDGTRDTNSRLTSFVENGRSSASGTYPTSATQNVTRPRSTTTPNNPLTSAPLKAKIITGAFSKNRRSLLLIRSAERVDRVFPDWITRCFADDGTYEPYDLNFPSHLPLRPHGPAEFHNDTPITTVGTASANLLGRALRHRGVAPAFILTSPALRSIQTASAICSQLATNHPVICIEPGLFEPAGWYHSLPTFLNNEQLRRCGYLVSNKYQPVVSLAALEKLAGMEYDAQAAGRVSSTLSAILKAAKKQIGQPDALILVVSHAFSLDAAVRVLAPSDVPMVGRGFLGLAYPYLSILSLQEHNDAGDWSIMRRDPIPIPSLHYGHFSNTALPLITDPEAPPHPV